MIEERWLNAQSKLDQTLGVFGMTTVQAVRPWDSIDSSGYLYYGGKWIESDVSTYDSQAQIELCLRCPIADECQDCIGEPSKQRRKKTRTLRRLLRKSVSGR